LKNRRVILFFIMIFILGGCASKLPKEDKNYFKFVSKEVNEPLFDALETIGYKLDDFSEDLTLVTDEKWLSEMYIQINRVNTTCDTIINYDKNLIPKHYEYAHSLLVLSANDYKKAMFVLPNTLVLNPPTTEMTKFKDLIGSASDYIMDAFYSIDENQPD